MRCSNIRAPPPISLARALARSVSLRRVCLYRAPGQWYGKFRKRELSIYTQWGLQRRKQKNKKKQKKATEENDSGEIFTALLYPQCWSYCCPHRYDLAAVLQGGTSHTRGKPRESTRVPRFGRVNNRCNHIHPRVQTAPNSTQNGVTSLLFLLWKQSPSEVRDQPTNPLKPNRKSSIKALKECNFYPFRPSVLDCFLLCVCVCVQCYERWCGWPGGPRCNMSSEGTVCRRTSVY